MSNNLINQIMEAETEFKEVTESFVRYTLRLQKQVYVLTKENQRLRKRLGETNDVINVPFSEVENTAKVALGVIETHDSDRKRRSKSGWQTALEQQGGFTHSQVEQWKRDGLAPAQALREAQRLQPEVLERKPRIPWRQRPEIRVTLENLYLEKQMSYEIIAMQMSRRFPEFEFNANVVSGAINNLGLTKNRKT